MSLWLSSANKAVGSARGAATAEARRQVTAAQTEATRQMIDLWSGKAFTNGARSKKRR